MRDLFNSYNWHEEIAGVFVSPSGHYTIDVHSKLLINPDGYLSSINDTLLAAITNMDGRIQLLKL